MPPHNRAAWLMKKQDDSFVVNDAPYNAPEAHELVIKTMAVAINPADVILQKVGIMIDSYPAILGCDAAGIVEEVGSAITDFKPGDRVIGQAQPLPGGIYKHSGFQQYVVLRMPLIAKVPDSTSWTEGVVLPLGVNTAASCLFQEGTLGLEMPPGQGSKGKTLLIWGASSSVGSCGVQLAAAAGYEVFGIASKKNHEFIKSIGAAQTFDYNNPGLVDEITAALEGKICIGAVDIIGKERTLHPLCEILHKSDGRKIIATVAPGSHAFSKFDVSIRVNLAVGKPFSAAPVGPHIWRVFIESALTSGSLQCKPNAEIVGHGLESIQKACDLLAQGVSAKKLVIAL